MVIRILGLIIGVVCLVVPFVGGFDSRTLTGMIIGVAFVTYAIGGQKLLAKVAPRYADKSEPPRE